MHNNGCLGCSFCDETEVTEKEENKPEEKTLSYKMGDVFARNLEKKRKK